MNTGALTRFGAASQKTGLMASKRRRSAACFGDDCERLQKARQRRPDSRLGRSRQVRASNKVVSPKQPREAPATATADCQKGLRPIARVVASAAINVCSGLKAANQGASTLVGA